LTPKGPLTNGVLVPGIGYNEINSGFPFYKVTPRGFDMLEGGKVLEILEDYAGQPKK
jgi:hypothetical protein